MHAGSALFTDWSLYRLDFLYNYVLEMIVPTSSTQINIGFFVMAVYIMRKHTKRQKQRSNLTSVA